MHINSLNDKQQEAVHHVNGPLLVVAGAGSGKTKILTERIAYLIKEIGISPSSLLAITFTNKAAKEMKERLYKLIGDEVNYIQVSTFHSFGYKIIRENYQQVGLESNFTILDESDSVAAIKGILKEFNLDPEYYNPKIIKQKISGAKNEMIGPLEYEKYAKTEFEKVVQKVYSKYDTTLRRNNAVDFDDLLLLPIQLFKKSKEILEQYQEKFQYLLIDEYQDTNEVQYLLSKMIANKYQNICVVGDGDQAIYSWRGANHKNILHFEQDYKNAKVVLLEENYRSTSTILKAANDVIKNNRIRKEKNLWTSNIEGEKIRYYRSVDEKDEARYVIKEIKRLKSEGYPYDEMAILFRTNAQSRVMEEALRYEMIPHKVVGAFAFYSRKEIKDLVAYLKIIYNEKDNINLLRIINVPKRGIGASTINKLEVEAMNQDKPIYEVIQSGKELEFKALIESLKEYSKNSSLTELVERVIETTRLGKDNEKESELEASLRMEYLNEFKSVTKSFEEKNGFISLEDFLMEISLVSNSEDRKEEQDKVSVMTVHAAKGLEFDAVFVIGLEESLFPHSNSFDSNENMEEERRLCYVAITRAKKHLYLLNASKRLIYGDYRSNPISRFIKEISPELLITNKSENKKEERFYDEVDYQVGEHVLHDKFGEGVIVSIRGMIMSIVFPHPYDRRSFMKNHKSIKKR